MASLLLALAAVGGLALGACTDDDKPDASLKVKTRCNDYCKKANVCDDEVDRDECETDCINAMNDCQADEQDEALDKLRDCSEESCDDLTACTIEVGAQCVFGL